jgi:CheY-like chemotaxis protein
MDGLEATKIIRGQSAVDKNKNIPIIAMTAHAMNDDKQRCIDSGMDDYISKPVKPSELARILEKHLESLNNETYC